MFYFHFCVFLFFTYLSFFFFRCGHGIPWWRWNKDNQLYVKVLKICTRKGWWWWEKRKLNLLLTVYILYAVYEERKYWNEFWSLLFSLINSVQHPGQYPCRLVQQIFFLMGEMHMQLKFKIEMLLSETRAFPGELKVMYCILHCLSVHLS